MNNYNYLFEKESLATSYGAYFNDDRTHHDNIHGVLSKTTSSYK